MYRIVRAASFGERVSSQVSESEYGAALNLARAKALDSLASRMVGDSVRLQGFALCPTCHDRKLRPIAKHQHGKNVIQSSYRCRDPRCEPELVTDDTYTVLRPIHENTKR